MCHFGSVTFRLCTVMASCRFGPVPFRPRAASSQISLPPTCSVPTTMSAPVFASNVSSLPGSSCSLLKVTPAAAAAASPVSVRMRACLPMWTRRPRATRRSATPRSTPSRRRVTGATPSRVVVCERRNSPPRSTSRLRRRLDEARDVVTRSSVPVWRDWMRSRPVPSPCTCNRGQHPSRGGRHHL